MVISTAKTKVMTTAATPLGCKLTVDNKTVDQKMEVNYLGVTITSCGSKCKVISCQIIKKKQDVRMHESYCVEQ